MKKTIISLCTITAIMALVILAGCDRFMKIVAVKTIQYSNLSSTSAVLKGEVVSTGSSDHVNERGFFYSTNKNLKPAITVECGSGQKGVFESTVKGLQPGTKYYYQAYAKSEDDMDVGDVLEFTTYQLKFTVTTEQPEIGNLGSVTLKGSYDNVENFSINTIGFEYAKNGNFRNADTVFLNTTQTPFSTTVELDDATYYCRAFVIAEDQTLCVNGNTIEFASVEHIPTVTTGNADEITSNSAKLNATVTGQINTKGFYWSANSDFSTPTKVDAGFGTANGMFEQTISGLTPSTTYYYKAYVTYHNGTIELLGEIKEFTTHPNE